MFKVNKKINEFEQLKFIDKQIKQYTNIYENYKKKIENLQHDKYQIKNYIDNINNKIINTCDLDEHTRITFQENILNLTLKIKKIDGLLDNYFIQIGNIINSLNYLETQLMRTRYKIPKLGLKSMFI